MAYTKYSLTPADNNTAPPNGAPEGMLPSAVNDTMRDMMSQIRDVGDGIRDGTYTMTAAKITGGTITGITDLVIADGGTGASTAENARANLGVDNYGNMKNRIINGAMAIDQRLNGGTLSQSSGSFAYSVDRWNTFFTQLSKLTFQQNAGSVTPPVGFNSYLGATTQSLYSVGASDFFTVQQSIEGHNWNDMGWGTANAKTVTLSFWVRSSLTGTFGGSLRNFDGTRSYPFTYTVSSANTWENKTVTIAGDTTGTWQKTISIGVTVFFGLGVGSTYSGTAGSWSGSDFLSATGAVSVVGTNGATFYITGVQLEAGTQATSFEYKHYSTELQLCQRYYQQLGGDVSNDILALASTLSGEYEALTLTYPTAMRSSATATKVGTWNVINCGQPTIIAAGKTSVAINALATSNSLQFNTTGTSTYITLSAEL